MKILIAATTLLSMAAGPVLALSCMAPNLGSSFNQYQAAAETYYIAVGNLKPIGAAPEPQTDSQGQMQSVTSRYQFSGAFLSRDGLGATRQFAVDVTLECLSAWCGWAPGPERMAVFLERADNRFALSRGVCGGDALSDPTPVQVEALQVCLREGECGPDEIKLFGEDY